MEIIIDSRQKEGKHNLKHTQIQEIGYAITVKKLEYGDYCFASNPKVSVDTKQSIDELYLDLMQEHGRFRQEIIRAYRENGKLIILTEDELICNLAEVKKWKSKRGKANGTVIYDKAMKLHYAYGVEFAFCKPNETGLMIVNILNEYNANSA